MRNDDIDALFLAVREDVDSEPFAHQANLEAAVAAYRPTVAPVSKRTLAAGWAGLLLLVSTADGVGRLLGWW